jgi:serine/threonine protein kinase
MEGLSINGEQIIKQKVIGEGNFSQVFLAETKTGKVAAIKKVKKSVKDKTAYELAKKEATILTGLHSPHVLELLDTYEEHNYFYLIEKFYKGQTLESILKKRKSLSTNEC